MKISTDLGGGGISDVRSAGAGGSGQSAAVQNGGSGSSAGLTTGSTGDEVSLSGISRILQSSSAQRTEALASLAGSVRTGSYHVPSSDVGRSMISEILSRSSSL